MTLLCDQCGKPLLPLANYCSYCGGEAPRKTVVVSQQDEKTFENPVYCPECGKEAPEDSLYCASCGSSLYEMPESSTFYCPQCKEKNRSGAKLCVSCGLHFQEWCAMQGPVAQRIGYKGNLVLKEKMTGNFYHFLTDDTLTIGRSHDNTICISAPWVSGSHCLIDNRAKVLTDPGSKNGTFVNRDSRRVGKLSLDTVFELNIAGLFTFTFFQTGSAFVLYLSAILNQDLCRKMADLNKLDELRKHYFILYSGNFEVNIYKLNGDIAREYDPLQEAYRFTVLDGHYYFFDLSGKTDRQLLLKNNNNLPPNWEVVNNL